MNHGQLCRMLGVAIACLAAALPASALPLRCPPDAVKTGDLCVDKYESSIWRIPADNPALIRAVQLGRVTVAQLTEGGATPVSSAITGSNCAPSFPPTFDATGNWTSPLFAVSVAGIAPASCVT